ncbi:hypothetical protein GIB67_004095 [Kingdonia uniflora]|uniref:3-hydroxyisobutyrate dehydrogenase-like NAD-binding domain-containing protein n=1 Tax=Kingdonia uniflora TaxID=39325 RepID=A0A7J7NRH8_9MAGN|nr:hypothetical protein GIB67_004095 [Kingdonia uniflora]
MQGFLKHVHKIVLNDCILLRRDLLLDLTNLVTEHLDSARCKVEHCYVPNAQLLLGVLQLLTEAKGPRTILFDFPGVLNNVKEILMLGPNRLEMKLYWELVMDRINVKKDGVAVRPNNGKVQNRGVREVGPPRVRNQGMAQPKLSQIRPFPLVRPGGYQGVDTPLGRGQDREVNTFVLNQPNASSMTSSGGYTVRVVVAQGGELAKGIRFRGLGLKRKIMSGVRMTDGGLRAKSLKDKAYEACFCSFSIIISLALSRSSSPQLSSKKSRTLQRGSFEPQTLVLKSLVVEEISQHDALMYIVTHIRASLSSSVVKEMENEEEEVKEGFVLVARKGCFGLPAACSSCLPVYLYLRFANVDFDLRFNLVYLDSAERNMSSSSLLQGERQGDNASRSSSSSSSSSGSGSSSSDSDSDSSWHRRLHNHQSLECTKLSAIQNKETESINFIGDKALYDMISPFLDIMGKSRFYLGDVGNGTAMKLVVNMIMGSIMASFSEGLLLSEKVGLDPKILVKVVSQGAISALMFSLKDPSMVQSKYPTAFPLKLQLKYPTAFPLKHQQKDLRLALGLAESVSHVY